MHCVRLREVRLPYTAHTIHVKAFMDFARTGHPTLHHIASRAFLDCTVFRRLTKLHQAKEPHGGGRMLKKMPSRSAQLCFFLQGSRRYVCRGCTSHLRLVKERDTNQAAKPETEQTEPHQQTQPTQKGARFVPQVGCVSQWRRVKPGETKGQ